MFMHIVKAFDTHNQITLQIVSYTFKFTPAVTDSKKKKKYLIAVLICIPQ